MQKYLFISKAQHDKIIAFAQEELRSRFNNRLSDIEGLGIIISTRDLGFKAIAEEMIKELASEKISESFIRDVIKNHEEKNLAGQADDITNLLKQEAA